MQVMTATHPTDELRQSGEGCSSDDVPAFNSTVHIFTVHTCTYLDDNL